jgi:hypothetical protein
VTGCQLSELFAVEGFLLEQAQGDCLEERPVGGEETIRVL